MSAQEPTINPGNLNNEELYRWLVNKVEKLNQLRRLKCEKASLDERLELNKEAIRQISQGAWINITESDASLAAARLYPGTEAASNRWSKCSLEACDSALQDPIHSCDFNSDCHPQKPDDSYIVAMIRDEAKRRQ